MKPGGGKIWFSAAELAALKLPGLSSSKRKVNERADLEGWKFRSDERGMPLAQPRQGRGGGLEFHVNLLPAAARSALAAKGVSIVAHVSAEPIGTAAARWRWFDGASDKTKADARERLAAVALVDAYHAAGMTQSAAVATAAAQSKVGKSTLWCWIGLVDGIAVDDRLAFLAPQRAGGGAEAEIHADVWQVFKSDYLRPEEPTLTACYRRAVEYATARAIAVPCCRSFQRKLERQVDERVITLMRKGAEALRQQLPPQKRSVMDLHAMEAVNIDGHKFDVFVKWPDGRVGRALMVAIQDLYSRKFLAWRIDESENALTTRLVFADLFRDWGIPKGCLLDNGRAFASKWITGGAKTRFRGKIKDEDPTGILTALSIAIHWALPYRGSSKPIERGFRDLCDTIARHPACAGAYTGNTPLAKPENYGSKAIPIEQFRAIVDAGMAAHNRQPGRRTETAMGRSFDEAFAESYASAQPGVASPEQLRLALLTAEELRCDRKTSVITLEGNRYWAAELADHSGEKLTVRFDPDNLHSEIHVYDRLGRFIVTAPVIAAVGFFDKESAQARVRHERGVKKAVKELAKAENLLAAAELAAMMPAYEDEAPTPRPTVLRAVRHGGQTAAMRAERADAQEAQASILDRMSTGMRKLHAVK